MNLISTLFTSKEKYLHKQARIINAKYAFPSGVYWETGAFFERANHDSLIVSGGTIQERTSVIYSMLFNDRNRNIIILHNGNLFLGEKMLNYNGLKACTWGTDEYGEMRRSQMLTILTSDSPYQDLAVFYAFAIDVCVALGVPISIDGIAGINWLGVEWQHQLLSLENSREIAIDLLSRYDKKMAEKAAIATCHLERLTRNFSSGNSIFKGLESNEIVTRNIRSSTSMGARHSLEVLTDMMERGQRFTLVLDDVYVEKHPLIYENIANVKLILSSSDLYCDVSDRGITKRKCGVVALRHNNAQSASKISKQYFGEYNRLVTGYTAGVGKRNTDLITNNKNQTISINETRDYRLRPEILTNLRSGEAVARLADNTEGMLYIEGTDQRLIERG